MMRYVSFRVLAHDITGTVRTVFAIDYSRTVSEAHNIVDKRYPLPFIIKIWSS